MSDLIPDEHRDALGRFTELPKTSAEHLLESLERADPALLVSDVASKVSKEANLPYEEVRAFLLMLASMARTRAMSGLKIDEFVDVIADSASDEPKLARADWALARTYLVRALATRAIQITAKALQVVGEHQRSICHARILSDLRPVFDDETLDARAVLITHHLKLAYHEHGGPDEAQEVFVSMDRSDLLRLRAVIERALGKHAKLEELAAKTGLPILASRSRS